MWGQKYLVRRASQISEGLSSSAPLYRPIIVRPCNKIFDFCSTLPNQNSTLQSWLQSSDLNGWKMDQYIDISAWRIKQMSRIQIQRHLFINIQQMSWQTDLNHSLQNILFQWICSKFFKFQHWHNSFWPPTSRRLLEAKNSPQRPKLVGRSF